MIKLLKKHLSFLIPEAGPHNYHFFFLFFLLALLTFHHAWVPGMFMDGAIYATLGQHAATLGHWLVPKLNDGAHARFAEHPPFYFIYIGLLFKIFGNSWTTARLAVLILNTALISVLWLELKKYTTRRQAYLSVLILLLCYPFIRRSRSPMLEIPLTLFALLSLISYFKAFLHNRFKDYFLAGLFWGCALLIKGHAAFFIALTIFFHLLITKNIKKLYNFRLWFALFFGFAIFGLWPLALKLSNNFDIFERWFGAQFLGTVVNARGKKELDILLYFSILAKDCLPWFILSLIGSWQLFKNEKKDHIGFLFLAWFWALLLPFSFIKWKYSHYILPAYLPMAALAAYSFNHFKEKVSLYFAHTIKVLGILAALVFLCLPVGIKSERDKELFEVVQLTKYLKAPPQAWAEVSDNMEYYWSFLPPLSFVTDAGVYHFSLAQVEDYLKGQPLADQENWIFYMNTSDVQKLKEKFPQDFEQKMAILITIPHQERTVVIEKKLLPENAYFGVMKK